MTDIERTPRIYFVPQPGKVDRAATELEAVGKWLLTDKKGKALCHMELLNTASKRSDDSKSLKIVGDCSASVQKTKIGAWQIDEIKLGIIGGEDYDRRCDGFVTDDGKYHLKHEK